MKYDNNVPKPKTASKRRMESTRPSMVAVKKAVQRRHPKPSRSTSRVSKRMLLLGADDKRIWNDLRRELGVPERRTRLMRDDLKSSLLLELKTLKLPQALR
mmetsp:Transcript_32174/g.73934  ORF Transcript_32174/g.73934 Transcript_32174/m.73934 type:complete len:101 (-) Transcript_32174:150-452(-)|eukprot:CAMPEP_0116828522 /NCGR_PEP_ID=MMETSP0418-20121206/3697_1 /TAXON_ID=1158023 /ORGANISM="Astrosyne radiata, Strain 13vi08-1A" /LENGTH=100 /DNA_ID=CAMNT_0004457409 /DNA_START=110 /DNA_END=412 /DNA_ORIENTATION=+